MKNHKTTRTILAALLAIVLAFGVGTPAFAASADEAAAQEVADMIDAIYVQKRTEETDAQCAAAKAGWDALTEEQKELVEGENADPDYFGRDTGDASLDGLSAGPSPPRSSSTMSRPGTGSSSTT